MGSRRSIVLTGFMGTGKTTVGRILATRLGRELIDTDRVIEERHGPISAIFRERGEEGFRALERELAGELAGRTGLVVSTGGRMMVDPVNAEVLGRAADVFCLTASVDTILARVDGPDRADRPLLAGDDARGRIAALLAERDAAYARFTQIATDDRTPDQVADEVAARLPPG